jgi:hypothetical protein
MSTVTDMHNFEVMSDNINVEKISTSVISLSSRDDHDNNDDNLYNFYNCKQ